MSRGEVAELVQTLTAVLADMHPGDRFFSEHQIMTSHQVSRAVARAAVQTLESRHLVRRVQGTGTFVNRRIDYTISGTRVPSFHRSVEAAGATARTVLLRRDIVTATGAQQEELGVEPGTEALRLERLGYIDDLPVCYFQELFSPRAIPELRVAIEVIESVSEVLQSGGFQPIRSRSSGTVDRAPRHVCDRLGLLEDSETWLVDSLITDRDSGQALMVARAWTRMDQVRMIFESGP